MKINVTLCVVCCMLCAGDVFAQDRIIAIVNKDIITQTEVTNFARFLRMQLAAKYKGKELEDKFEEMLPDVLNRLVEDKLILQEAKKAGIKADENRLKGRIQQMKERYVSEKDFMDDIVKNGLTLGDVEAKIKDQLMMFQIVEEKIKDKIVIKPQEVTNFYEEHRLEFSSSAQRRVISLTADDFSKASQALAEIKNGRDFQETANDLGLEVQDLGRIEAGQLNKELDQAISVLQVDEVSDIVRFEGKFYIFKLLELIPAKERPFEEVKPEIYNYLVEQQMQERVTVWLDELKLKSYIEIKSENL